MLASIITGSKTIARWTASRSELMSQTQQKWNAWIASPSDAKADGVRQKPPLSGVFGCIPYILSGYFVKNSVVLRFASKRIAVE
jgi:hypothetical protein